MKKYLFKLSIVIVLLFYINDCSAVYVTNPASNSTVARGLCKYTLNNGYYVDAWILDYNACVQTYPHGNVDPNGFDNFYDALYVKWKNIETNASAQLVSASWHWTLLQGQTDPIVVGPFTLIMPVPTFISGASLNIPCYVTTPVTISLNSYINTEANGIDQGETITSHFEWTLPSGWQTTSGQTGTFVSSSSISVIPPASTTSTSISARAKANTQYSQPATLQITRNLNSFSITGQTNVVYNSTYRYEVPSIPAATYSWQLPTGWSGSSNSNYIDVTVGCGTGNIVAIMTGCNGSKSSQTSIAPSIIAPGTTISGPNFACASGTQYSVPGLVSGTTISWTSSTNLTLSNASSNYCTYSANSNGDGWIEATINAPACGTSVALPRKTVWAGTPIVNYISGPSSIGTYQPATYYAELSSYAAAPDSYFWGTSPLPGVSITQNGQSASIMFTQSGYYQVVAKAHNTCDWSSYSMRIVNVTSGYYLAISPNPSSGETTVELANDNKEALAALSEWDYEVYDTMQGLKEKKTKLKEAKAKINTNNWKEGIYIVRAKVCGEIITEKLMVKH